MARENYDTQLKALKNQMLFLGSMIEDVISKTINALVTQDVESAKVIAAGDEKVDAQVRVIEQQCYLLLLRQQPIAGDLRAVSAAMKMITDMERIGDHGTDISELTILMSTKKYPEVINVIANMAKETMVMLIDAINTFEEMSLDKANAVIAKDDVIDELFVRIKSEIAENMKRPGSDPELELDLLMVTKYLERIGDHATNIAEWVIFSITGELPKD